MGKEAAEQAMTRNGCGLAAAPGAQVVESL